MGRDQQPTKVSLFVFANSFSVEFMRWTESVSLVKRWSELGFFFTHCSCFFVGGGGVSKKVLCSFIPPHDTQTPLLFLFSFHVVTVFYLFFELQRKMILKLLCCCWPWLKIWILTLFMNCRLINCSKITFWLDYYYNFSFRWNLCFEKRSSNHI